MAKFLLLLFSLGALSEACAGSNTLSMRLHDVNLADAITLLARSINKNVIVSSAIKGTVTLTMRQVESQNAFDFFLLSHGLAKRQVGSLIYVATQEELLKRQEGEAKMREGEAAQEVLLTRFWPIHYSKAADIAQLLEDEHASFLSKRGHLNVDKRTNIIFMRDIRTNVLFAERLIKKLDVPLKQIAIEARLAVVDRDYEEQLGIQFTSIAAAQGKKKPPVEGGNEGHLGQFSLAVARLADNSLLDIKLSALEKSGHAKLISSPSLFTANQQPASIEAGEEVPYQEVSDSGGTATVFKKAVLGLKVTPQLLPNHRVLLQLQINQDRPSNRLIQGVPAISTRQIKSNVLVRAGETVILGGIYERNKEVVQQGLPFLSQLPVIGLLFKHQDIRTTQRELLIFVTPRILT